MIVIRHNTFVGRHNLTALAALVIISLAALGLVFSMASRHGTRNSASISPPNMSQLPVRFEPNAGQSDPQARFVARASGSTLLFTASGVAMSISELGTGQNQADNRQPAPTRSALASMNFLGTNPSVQVEGSGVLPGKANYITGNDRTQWHTGLPTYASITYSGIYSGVDLAYSGDQGHLKGTYTLASGADPSQIRWRYEGAASLSIGSNGDLAVNLRPDGSSAPLTITEMKPVAWQEVGGSHVPVSASYALGADGTISFALGSYDRTRTLTIDPTVTYGTYLGGSTGPSQGNAIAVDPAGNFYVMGITGAANFPVTPGAYRTGYSGANDAFVAKFDPNGGLVYATYLGGSGQEGEILSDGGIAVDGAGDAIVVGSTASSNYPTTADAFQPAYGGDGDAFVTKLNPAGSNLVYSTYLGGSCAEYGYAAAVDPAGNFYVGGTTCSPNFPTVNPFQPYHNGYDGFVARFSGNSAVYSTFLGGTGNSAVYGVGADSDGNAYMAGKTDNNDFPTVNPIQATRAGYQDAFLSKLNPSGSALVYSTYLGGSQPDMAYGIAVDALGQAYIAGLTYSTDFPTHNPLQGYGGQEDAFVTKVNAAGSALLFSTYLGGTNSDYARSIAVDPVQNIYVAGITLSNDFPLANPIRPNHGNSASDGFFTKYPANGSGLDYSSYLGAYNANVLGIAVDAAGNAYMTGQARTDLPVTGNALQPTPQWGNGDAYALRVYEEIPSPTVMPSSTTPPTSTDTATTILTATSTSIPTSTRTPTPAVTPSATPIVGCNIQFTDVPPGSTFYDYIQCLACQGIISGYPDGTFRPNDVLTRGQLAKIVSGAAGFSDNVPAGEQTFEDVLPDSTFWLYVERVYDHRAISGYPCGQPPAGPCWWPLNLPYFMVGNYASRGQIAKIVSTAVGYNDDPGLQRFQDVPPWNTFYAWINRMSMHNVVSGYACGGRPDEPCVPPDNLPYFESQNPVTRGQLSKMVSLAFFPGCSAARPNER